MTASTTHPHLGPTWSGRASSSALGRMRPATCAIPLGLQHPDHQEVRQIALSCVGAAGPAVDWIVYEDLPYGRSDTDGTSRAEAVGAIESAGFQLSELRPDLDADMATKAAAVACYPSQLLALRLSSHLRHRYRGRALLVPTARDRPSGPSHSAHSITTRSPSIGDALTEEELVLRLPQVVGQGAVGPDHPVPWDSVTGSGQDLTDGPGRPAPGPAADTAVGHDAPRGDGGHTGQDPTG